MVAAGKRSRFSSSAFCRDTRLRLHCFGRCCASCSPEHRSKLRRKACACRFHWRRFMELSDDCGDGSMRCEVGSPANALRPPACKLILCSKRSNTCKPSSLRTGAPSRRTSGIFSRRFWAKHGLIRPLRFSARSQQRGSFCKPLESPDRFCGAAWVRASLLRQSGWHSLFYVQSARRDAPQP